MRPFATQSSRIFAGTLAVLLALLVSTPKDPEAATNHHSRTTRSGGQRLESADAVDHSYEDQHPMLDPASDDAPVTALDHSHAPPGVGLPEKTCSFAPPSQATLLHSPPAQLRSLAPHLRPHLGRAPPLFS